MIVLMKCLDEEFAVERVLKDFHDEQWVHRVIVIDGGSTDYTVQELKRFEKVEVFIHPWLDWYHDMEITQSNIALSYVPHGELAVILDFDERLSPELKKELASINSERMLPNNADIGHVPRRTFEVLRHEDSPFAMLDEEGWPHVSHQIGQYPDYQCRIIRKDYRMRWINSPHHMLIGWEGMQTINLPEGFDVLHFEKDDRRHRLRIERKWARTMARRKELSLPPDVYDVRIHPEVHKYTQGNEWK
nr:hypothetical protein 4 [bacterium]